MAATRRFRGDPGALTGLRLRRIVSFLRHHRLYDTAHALEGQTGAFFDAAHFRRLLRAHRWADASSYALAFVAVGESCSCEADLLIVRILILRVMADLAAGRVRAGDDLFHRLYASLQANPDAHQLRRILLSMRSDRARASRLFHRLRPMAVDAILNLADKCPELKAKARLPHCTSDPAYATSLGPVQSSNHQLFVPHRLWGYKAPQKNKARHIPADVLARSFMRKRALISHEMTSSGVTSSPVFKAMLATSPRPTNIVSISSTANTEQAFDSRKGKERLQTTEDCAEEADEDILVIDSLETRRPFLYPSQPTDALVLRLIEGCRGGYVDGDAELCVQE